MKYFITLIRVFVGCFFILSGFLKLVDPIGTSYKMDEYFAPNFLNLSFLIPYTLWIAFFFVVIEVLLGILLLLGIFKGFTLSSLLLFLSFFAYITFRSANENLVKDCGCFGDFIKFTPWQSFYKDLLLLLLILIIIFQSKYIKPFFSHKLNYSIAGISTLIAVGIALWGIYYLPILDFRPFAKGENILKNMQTIRNPKIKITYTLKNKRTSEKKEVSDKQYIDQRWYEKTDWELLSDLTKDEIIDPGEPAKIHDFILGDELNTELILKQPEIYFIVNYDPLTPEENLAIQKFIQLLEKNNKIYYVLAHEELLQIKNQYLVDGTILKTMIRSSPGVLWIKKAFVQDYWTWKNLPTSL